MPYCAMREKLHFPDSVSSTKSVCVSGELLHQRLSFTVYSHYPTSSPTVGTRSLCRLSDPWLPTPLPPSPRTKVQALPPPLCSLKRKQLLPSPPPPPMGQVLGLLADLSLDPPREIEQVRWQAKPDGVAVDGLDNRSTSAPVHSGRKECRECNFRAIVGLSAVTEWWTSNTPKRSIFVQTGFLRFNFGQDVSLLFITFRRWC